MLSKWTKTKEKEKKQFPAETYYTCICFKGPGIWLDQIREKHNKNKWPKASKLLLNGKPIHIEVS